MPEQFAEWRAGWQVRHPQWEHVLITDENLPPLRNQELYDWAEHIAPGFEGQLRADVLRYELLAEYGGVYADLDCEALRPLDGFLEAPAFCGWEVQDRWANNAVMGAERGHPWVEALVTGLPASVLRNEGRRPSVVSGPRYLTPITRQHPDVVIHPQATFYPYGFTEVGTPAEHGPWPGSFVAHHWNNTRRLRGGSPAKRRAQPVGNYRRAPRR